MKSQPHSVDLSMSAPRLLAKLFCVYPLRGLFQSLALFFAFNQGAAAGTTYYIDATNGNDTWNGTSATAVSVPVTNGPWQSLERVNNAVLTQGDRLLFRCGETWKESLTLNANGSQGVPVTIGNYATGTCASKPLFDGSTAIPDHAWVRQSGNIYTAKLPANLVKMSGASGGFQSWSATNDHRLVLDASCATADSPCISLTSGATISLASSNTFAVTGGSHLDIKFRVKAPAGVNLTAVLRRGGPTYENVAPSTAITGTGAWQDLTYQVKVTKSLTNARVDFSVPGGANTLSVAAFSVAYPFQAPTQVRTTSGSVSPAHHPNRGFKATNPNGIFANIPTDSDRVLANGKTVSTYLNTGPDLVLPSGASILAGQNVIVRINSWLIDELTVASAGGGRIYFTSPSMYKIDKNWGYYLSGAAWMLDSPGEWHFDPSNNTLSIWMPDGNAPGSRVSVSGENTGLNVASASNLVIDGLDIKNFNTGVVMEDGVSIRLINSAISNSGTYAVDAVSCVTCEISGSTIRDSMRDAIYASSDTGRYATGLRIVDNSITNTGVSGPTLTSTDLPIRTLGAIRAGLQAVITGNQITNSSYTGVQAFAGNQVSGNRIENSCIVFNDCSAIYAGHADNNSVISQNTVLNVVGNFDGAPSYTAPLASGVYLDELASGVQVTSNVLVNADDGIHIHNAFNNNIAGNTFYGNRRYQIWAQENTNILRAAGDIYGNQVTGNKFFPAVPLQSVQHDTAYSSTSSFATYSNNRYSTLLLNAVANEAWNTGATSYPLPSWKSPRGQDTFATEISNLGYATFSTTGNNIVPNTNLTNGLTNWSSWNATSPIGVLSMVSCPQGTCIRYPSGGSPGLVSTPNFSVEKDRWYRASFDATVTTTGQSVSVLVRRGGGGSNQYESLAGAPLSFSGSTQWRRFSFVFKAIKTVNANDPVTLDNGARLDFISIQPGTTLSIGKVEILPLTPVETSLKTRILVNSEATPRSPTCPDAATDPTLCANFVKFSDGTQVSWPILLAPYSSEVVFSRDSSLVDPDGDGVPTFQDQCPGTAQGDNTNGRGCSFAQSAQG